MRIRRRNIAWLAILSALVGIALLAGVTTPVQTVALVLLYAFALAASLLDFKPAKMMESVQRTSLARMRMSPQAQEAVARAARRGAVGPNDITLLDVGLIATSTNAEGMVMRRTRSFSKDDDGVRPYITLQVQPSAADTTSLLRFEIIDHNGVQQYVHEMKAYLREGEMNILADHQLPLATNERISGTGDGDLRVYIDGSLVGALSCTFAPSIRERQRQLSRSYEAEARLRERDESLQDDEVMSLEDLLRSRGRGNRER